ncbi:MAG: porin family protein [Bacteroidota bacterium]
MRTSRIIFFLLLVFALGRSQLLAQEWYVGVKGGPSWSKIKAESIMNEKSRAAFHIGLFFNRYLGKKISLQAEINYTALGSQHERTFAQNPNSTTQWKYDINYITIPVTLNYRPYQQLTLGAGFYSGFLAGFNVSREGAFSNTLETPSRSNLRSQDYGYNVQLQVHFAGISLKLLYLQSISKLPDSRLADLLINNAKNSAFQLSVTYRLFGQGIHMTAHEK